MGVDRRTITTGWERGWPASKDPRRPSPLPPLKEVCSPGTEAPGSLSPARVSTPAASAPEVVAASTPPEFTSEVVAPVAAPVEAAPVPPTAPVVETGPSSEPRAAAPGLESGPAPASAPSASPAPSSSSPSPSPEPPSSPSPAPAAVSVRDPVAEIAARQAALEAKEAANLAASLAVASHIASTGDAFLKVMYEAATSPAAQERLKAFIAERPERFPGLLAELGKAVEAASKASERIFSMSRLAQGKSTSIQEHRTEPKPLESPARAAAHIAAVMDELAALGRAHGRPRLEAIDVDVVDATTSEDEGQES